MNNNYLVVGHQPQFFPYLGIFNKILKSNIFVFVDSVKFSKKSWYNRTLLKDKKDNIFYFTIPVIVNTNQEIKDIKIADHFWKKKQLKSIELNYQSTKYFNDLFPHIENILLNKSQFLIDYSIPSMSIILEKIGFSSKKLFTQSSEKINGSKNELIVNLTKHFNAKKYLSGEGAKSYIDETFLKKNDIEHSFNKFEHPKYNQKGKIFTPNLSVIDCVFNNGFDKLKEILNN